MDKFGGCVAFVKKTAAILKIEENISIVKMDVFKFIRSTSNQYDYIFAGPPYPLPILDEIPDEVFKYKILAPGGLFVMEHNPNHDFKSHPCYQEERNYGTTIFIFFKNVESDEEE